MEQVSLLPGGQQEMTPTHPSETLPLTGGEGTVSIEYRITGMPGDKRCKVSFNTHGSNRICSPTHQLSPWHATPAWIGVQLQNPFTHEKGSAHLYR